MSTFFADIETYRNFFYLGMKRAEDGQRVGFELSDRKPEGFDKSFVRNLFLRHLTVGFNSQTFDLPLIWYALKDGVTPLDIHKKATAIIEGNIKWWDVQDFLGISIPYDINHIDLIEPQPNAFASLKILNGRMHGKQLQDLPYEPLMALNEEQMEVVANYCLHSDLDATENLWNTLKEPIQMRNTLSAEYGQDFRSKSDAQIGEAIVKKRVEAMTKARIQKAPVPPGTQFRYNVPAYMKFENPQLREIVERLRETDFTVKKDGKAAMPKWLDQQTVTIGNTTYSMGIGGLHSTEAKRSVSSNHSHVLVDADVASQYPSIILTLGLYPPALGPTFLQVYGDIKKERIEAKRAKNKVKDKGLKIALNGVYGKLGSQYSVLHSPQLLLAVTITGQLTLLMLIERAEAAGIPVVSGNTDGVLFHCPREFYAGIEKDRLLPSRLAEVVEQWEKDTGFDLEFGEYKAIYNSSVNSYIALKANGGHKRKGPLGQPWNEHPDDFDPVRGQLMKNPQMTIVSDAVLAKLKDNTPIEDTIRSCRDIRQFVTVIKVAKGATWRGEYLGKVVRYYWSTDGAPIFEAVAHETTGNFKKTPKTDGAAECMRLPDDFPHDIDYEKYITEAEDILKDIGYFGDVLPPEKRIRLTKANRLEVLAVWSIAA